MDDGLPGAVLFTCSHNVIRSAIAERLVRHLYGHHIYVDSCGVRAGQNDPFVLSVMDDIGIDISMHRPKSFDDLEDMSYDLVITLSPEAHHRAMELTRDYAIHVEYWPTPDPSDAMGSRQQILDGYYSLRDMLLRKIKRRFGSLTASGV